MDTLAEIRRLYYETTRATITRDLARAIELLKSMATEEERETAAAYMDGLSQMRSEWAQGQRLEHRRQNTGDRRQEAGGRRQEAGGRGQETGGRRQKTGGRGRR